MLGMEQGPPCEETLSACKKIPREQQQKKRLMIPVSQKQTNKQKPHNFGMHFHAPPWCVRQEDRGLVQISRYNWLLFFVYMHSGKTWFGLCGLPW